MAIRAPDGANKRSYHKSYQEDSPETVGAQGGVLGDGVVELHNLQGDGAEPRLQKGRANQKPTCLKDTPERELVLMRCRAYPGLPAKSCLQQTKSFCSRKNWTQFYHFDHFTLKEL